MRSLTILLLLSVVSGSLTSRVNRFRREANEQRRLSDEWLERFNDGKNSSFPSSFDCPCQRPAFPSSIHNSERSVLGFASLSSTGEDYNWTHINTVAWGSDALVCRAHCNGARALVAAPSFNLTQNFNTTEWVQNILVMVRLRHYDGIVFDYESPVTRQEAHTYVNLIRSTHRAFSKHNLQVITCVAWSPDGIDDRNYPSVALARASDYLYVMDYDTQSQIFSGPCIASANAPFAGMIRGIQRYLQLGIEAQKLILGVPWYGYRYPCLKGTTSNAEFCRIKEVPFRGVNCSDAAGIEVPFSTILSVLQNMTAKKDHLTGGIRRDEYMNAAFMNHVSKNGTVYQYWFDDDKSIRDKFAWAKSAGLGGVGPYTFDDLNPIQFPDESKAMWSAFDAFRDVGESMKLKVA